MASTTTSTALAREIERLRARRRLLAAEDELAPSSAAGFKHLKVRERGAAQQRAAISRLCLSAHELLHRAQAKLAAQAAGAHARNARLLALLQEAASNQAPPAAVAGAVQVCSTLRTCLSLARRQRRYKCSVCATCRLRCMLQLCALQGTYLSQVQRLLPAWRQQLHIAGRM